MPQPELFTLRGMVWWIVLVGVLPQPELFTLRGTINYDDRRLG
jgi:hypothetical protein